CPPAAAARARPRATPVQAGSPVRHRLDACAWPSGDPTRRRCQPPSAMIGPEPTSASRSTSASGATGAARRPHPPWDETGSQLRTSGGTAMPAPLGDHLATDASLHLLADHLTEALAGGELEPCLLHVATPDVDGFELGVKPLDGLHPTDVLLGTTAPADWHAVGIATHGWAYHVAERGDPARRRHRVHVVTLLSRSGEHAHRVRADDEDVEEALGAEPPGGEQVDLLRRVLGLRTDPPPCDPPASARARRPTPPPRSPASSGGGAARGFPPSAGAPRPTATPGMPPGAAAAPSPAWCSTAARPSTCSRAGSTRTSPPAPPTTCST